MTKQKPSLIYFGTPDYSAAVLKALQAADYPIVGVVTTPDTSIGRAKELSPTPVKMLAEQTNIPVFTPVSFRLHDNSISDLSQLSADFLVVFSYGKIIPNHILALPKYAALNIHPSLLPKYRGPSPVQSQIRDGITQSAVSIIEMTDKVDAGPIMAQEPVALPPDSTFQSAITHVSTVAATAMITLLSTYTSHPPKRQEQDDSQATYTKIISKADGFLDLIVLQQSSAVDIDRLIRAYTPWPGVWTTFEGKTLKFLPNKLVQLEGKSALPLKTLLNGYPQLKPFIDHLI